MHFFFFTFDKGARALSDTVVVLCVDNSPRWLHVPVHSVFWGADYGPVEVRIAQEASAHLLPSACWRGLLQG